VLVLHRVLAAMDRKVQAAGWRRGPDETLHGFAERIRADEKESLLPSSRATVPPASAPGPAALAGWYLEYAGLRYGGRLDRGRLEQLRQFVQTLPRRVTPRRD